MACGAQLPGFNLSLGSAHRPQAWAPSGELTSRDGAGGGGHPQRAALEPGLVTVPLASKFQDGCPHMPQRGRRMFPRTHSEPGSFLTQPVAHHSKIQEGEDLSLSLVFGAGLGVSALPLVRNIAVCVQLGP